MPTFPTPRSAYYGEPLTPGHEPDKADIVRLFEQTQAIATTEVLTGFVGALASLPSSGNTTGDTYAVMVAGDDGGVYEWDGTDWVKISSLPVALTTDEFALLAKAWAQSPTAPDPDDATSQSAKTWAELAQQVADGTAVTVFDPADLPAVTGADDGLFGQVVTTVGKQAWKVVSGAWAFQFWIDGPEYDNVTALIASTSSFADGTIIRIRTTGFAYEVDSTATVGFIENSATTAQKLALVSSNSGWYHVRGFGVKADGTDETSLLQSIVSWGLDLDFGGKLHSYGVTAPLAMQAGQKFKGRRATIKALGVMDHVIDRAAETKCLGIKIDCANTKNTAGTRIADDGAKYGMRFQDISDTETERCTFTRYAAGCRVVSSTAGAACKNHRFVNCTALAGHEWAGSNSSNGQVGAYVGSIASPEELNIPDMFSDPVYSEAEDVSEITFVNWRAYEGQYGIALHRCSNASVTASSFARMSRGVSMQQQSHRISVIGNTFEDLDSTGVHMARGIENVTVMGNSFKGVMQNDNVCIQGYYGVRDIKVIGNNMNSRFDLWDGGFGGENRKPNAAIKFAQQAEDILITGNSTRGYFNGVEIKTTRYETAITSSDQNYYNTGIRNITVRDNNFVGDYYTADDGFKLEVINTQTYGVDVRISGDWEDVDQGGWDVTGIVFEDNKAENVAFSYNMQTATMSGGANPPEFLPYSIRMSKNKSVNETAVKIGRGTISEPLAVVYEGNDWPDEQSFTPTLSGDGTAGAQTYTQQIGKWVARGNRVYVRGRLNLSVKDGATTGSAVIAGLPGTVKSGSAQDEAGVASLWSNFNLGTGYTHLGVQAEPGQSRLKLVKNGAGVVSAFVSSGEFSGTSQINFSCEYETA